MADEIDRSDAADAARFRWLLAGNGYFMEENYLCGHRPTSEAERDKARRAIDIESTRGLTMQESIELQG